MPRLLDRQKSLLAYLTSPEAIFGGRRGPADARLAGLDRGRLHLEARFSHDKRIDKIRRVFPKTFDLLGPGGRRMIRGFAASCPPTEIGRLHNARQFHDFLRRQWRRQPARPPYLPDVAACELAMAEARSFAEGDVRPPAHSAKAPPGGRIRRRPGVVLLRCRYDIQGVFGGGARRVAKRGLRLAIAVPAGADGPEVAELAPPVFDLLAALDDAKAHPRIGSAGISADLLTALMAHGLVEACA
jgi:hypothetical protein